VLGTSGVQISFPALFSMHPIQLHFSLRFRQPVLSPLRMDSRLAVMNDRGITIVSTLRLSPKRYHGRCHRKQLHGNLPKATRAFPESAKQQYPEGLRQNVRCTKYSDIFIK
jgi:hypothetical protein